MATITESACPFIKNYSNPYKPKVYFIESLKGGKYSTASILTF
ncbi:hypothetical protein [Polaribacter litorisediminis]|nr:hypothetical protein [Polaribacter litorisediminis]